MQAIFNLPPSIPFKIWIISNFPLYSLPHLNSGRFTCLTTQPISYNWSLSIPPEGHQKTFGFLIFSGGMERDQWHEKS